MQTATGAHKKIRRMHPLSGRLRIGQRSPRRKRRTRKAGDPMELRTDGLDLWVFRRDADAVRYLRVAHRRRRKRIAGSVAGGSGIPGRWSPAAKPWWPQRSAAPAELALSAESLWAVEHVYPIYNRRTESMILIPVFAAQVGARDPRRDAGLGAPEYRWCTADECAQLLSFRGLKEGLEWTRAYHLPKSPDPRPEFRLA